MQIAVKWVYQTVRLPSGGKIEAGQKPSLCFRGRKHMLCVAAGYPVRVVKRPAEDFDKMRPVMVGGAGEYQVADAVARLTGIGRRCGITAAARELIERARTLATVSEQEEEDIADEEEVFIQPQAPSAPDKETTMTTNETTEQATATAIGGNGVAPSRKRASAGAPRKASKKAPQKASGGTSKKAAPKGKPAAKTARKAQSGDGMPREGSVGRQIFDLLQKGQPIDKIAASLKKEPGYVSWWRWQLVKRGVLKASPKKVKAK